MSETHGYYQVRDTRPKHLREPPQYYFFRDNPTSKQLALAAALANCRRDGVVAIYDPHDKDFPRIRTITCRSVDTDVNVN